MIDSIQKFQKSAQNSYDFCVLIPSWNNLDYLKNCIRSIQKNSQLSIQIIVVVNEGRDKTKDWLDTQNSIDYIYSPTNIGICYGLNITRSLIKSSYVVYVNDDMYLLPDWDLELMNEIKSIKSKSFMLSSTMIEPTDSSNPCVVVKDYGQDLNSFKEDLLLKEYKSLLKEDWSGSMWPPNVVHIDIWDLVGGMSIEFSPGMYSDPDLARKLYEAGVRIYKGVGRSLVYHFGSKTTHRQKMNKGRKIFLSKWGITAGSFKKDYVRLGENYTTLTNEIIFSKTTLLINRLKRFLNSW